MGVIVENGGVLTTVQDSGRFGYEQYGLSTSGPMDQRAFQTANVLVGNDPNEAALEITLLGPTLRFTSPAVIAVTGADLSLRVNGESAETYRALAMKAGDTVSFGAPVSGCRAYMAFAGGLDIPQVLGSRSTLPRFKIGGYQGRRLEKGDELPLRNTVASLPNLARRRLEAPAIESGPRTVRVILGPQDDRFTEQGIADFLGGTYTVGKDFDRMGYRLEGPVVAHKTDGNIISDGIAIGSVQVPSDGHPIIMMADHQTVGGYTKIATVITVDLPVIGQSKAGDQIRFEKVSVDEAQQLYADWRRELAALQQQMEAPEPVGRTYRVQVNGQTFTIQVEEC